MRILIHIGAALLTLTVATNVQAGVYNDSYFGGVNTTYNPTDVIGNNAVFPFNKHFKFVYSAEHSISNRLIDFSFIGNMYIIVFLKTFELNVLCTGFF